MKRLNPLLTANNPDIRPGISQPPKRNVMIETKVLKTKSTTFLSSVFIVKLTNPIDKNKSALNG
jgi:hypothetical protein